MTRLFETIEYDVSKLVATIRLNRPDKLNAFTPTMNAEITKAVTQASKADDVRAIVITGEGKAFSAGEDLANVDDETDYAAFLRDRYNPMIEKIVSVEKPIVAAVNGVAAGAGLSLALACDFRLASERASLMNAFIHIGLIPDSGNLYFLSRLIGHAKTMEMAVMGEKIKAHDAEKLGLVNRVVNEKDWEVEVAEFAETLAQKPTKTIGLIKRYLHENWHLSLSEMLEKEAYGQKIAGQTHDHQEGLKAFKEKRKPLFEGK